MFQDPDFFQQYIDRYQELRRAEFSTTNLWRLTDDLGQPGAASTAAPTGEMGVVPRGGYQGEVNSLKNWLSNRVDFMDKQFVSQPIFATPGETVTNGYSLTISVPANTTVYYTLNGLDPRASAGIYGDDHNYQQRATGYIRAKRRLGYGIRCFDE
jgi:hypothetical protein